MAKTWQNLITEARETLQDSRSPYRYSETLLINLLNQGLQALATIRPDAFWSRFLDGDVMPPEIVLIDPDPDTDPNVLARPDDEQVLITSEVSVDLPMQFYNPLMFYVIGRAELIDDEFSNDGRAMALIGQFKASVIGI